MILIQINFTEILLMMPATKFAQKGYAVRSKMATRALDMKCLKMTMSPEPLVQIQNNSI